MMNPIDIFYHMMNPNSYFLGLDLFEGDEPYLIFLDNKS